jgi:hypothetical protein
MGKKIYNIMKQPPAVNGIGEGMPDTLSIIFQKIKKGSVYQTVILEDISWLVVPSTFTSTDS